DFQVFVDGQAQGGVQHRAVLGVVDVLAGEHPGAGALHVGGAGDVDEGGQGFVVDEVLGQVDAQPRGIEGQLPRPVRILGEHSAQVPLDDAVLLCLERLPLGGGGDVRHGF